MITIEKPGGYDQLLFKELDENSFTKGANFNFKENPPTADDSVIVETYASGVNYSDVILRCRCGSREYFDYLTNGRGHQMTHAQ